MSIPLVLVPSRRATIWSIRSQDRPIRPFLFSHYFLSGLFLSLFFFPRCYGILSFFASPLCFRNVCILGDPRPFSTSFRLTNPVNRLHILLFPTYLRFFPPLVLLLFLPLSFPPIFQPACVVIVLSSRSVVPLVFLPLNSFVKLDVPTCLSVFSLWMFSPLPQVFLSPFVSPSEAYLLPSVFPPLFLFSAERSISMNRPAYFEG